MQKKLKNALLIILMCASCFSTVFAGQSAILSKQTKDEKARPTQLTREAWHKKMVSIYPTGRGCFQAKHPSTTFEPITCKGPLSRPLSSPKKAPRDTSKMLGTGKSEYVLGAPDKMLLAQVVGSFPSASGVKSVSPNNQYSLQVNANYPYSFKTKACNDRPGCTVWQQFVYLTDNVGPGTPELYIAYWLLGYGAGCPSGWNQWNELGSSDCSRTSVRVSVPYVPVTQFEKVKLVAYANKNGRDGVSFLYDDEVYSVSDDANILDISEVWQAAEFNVFGSGDWAEAVFNTGSYLTVKIDAYYKNTQLSHVAPICVPMVNYFTGESNNLTAGHCSAAGYPLGNPPYIEFVESN
jgi:hypothetical protein